jgi:hypothetical protein
VPTVASGTMKQAGAADRGAALTATLEGRAFVRN